MDGNKFCRLCFNIEKNGYVEINQTVKEMLDVLLLDIDLNIVKNPVICLNCASIIQKLFCFKSNYIHVEKNIVSFAFDKEETQFEVKEMFYKNKNGQISSEEDNICRFCMNRLDKSNCVPIEILMKDTFYMKMLPAFISEMDFNIIMDPVICTSCKENLERYFELLRNCLNIERKIYVYCKDKGTNSMGHVESVNILRLLPKYLYSSDEYMRIYKNEGKLTCPIEEMENMPSNQLIKMEEVDMKEVSMNDESLSVYQCDKGLKETDDEKQNDYPELYKCTFCSYENIRKRLLQKHMLIHKDSSEIKMHKCTLCSYEAKRKITLQQHMLVHKDDSEVEMYKCTLCSYESKRKFNLQRHVLNHKNVSDVQMYSCTLCPFASKQKYCLKLHMLTHKDNSEVVVYKCELCSYQTKWSNCIKTHMLTHKATLETEMYKCEICDYKAKRKAYLSGHMLTHKGLSEIETYKCPLCSYAGKRKYCLKRHMLVHKNPVMYKCEVCDYTVKKEAYLKRHMQTHKDSGDKCGK